VYVLKELKIGNSIFEVKLENCHENGEYPWSHLLFYASESCRVRHVRDTQDNT